MLLRDALAATPDRKLGTQQSRAPARRGHQGARAHVLKQCTAQGRVRCLAKHRGRIKSSNYIELGNYNYKQKHARYCCLGHEIDSR